MSNFIKVKDKMINLHYVDFIWEDEYSLDDTDYFELGFSFSNGTTTVVLFESESERKKVINSIDSVDLIRVDTYIININKISYIEKLSNKIIVWFNSEDTIHIKTNELPKI